jgi:hypothetical protein
MSNENPHSPINAQPESRSTQQFIFAQPISSTIGNRLIQALKMDFLPKMQTKYPEMVVNALYSSYGQLEGVDFGIALDEKLNKSILRQLNIYLAKIQQADLKLVRDEGLDQPVSFTDLLGTYRVALNRYFVPIGVCIVLATFFAWLSWDVAQIQVDAVIVPEGEANGWGWLINGLVPVLIAACSITVIYLLVKYKGMNVFRVIMGIFVLFYNWLGFTYYVGVITSILYPSGYVPFWYYITYYVIYYGSAVFLVIVGIFFFKNRLALWQKNLLVLMFGVFLGSIFGTMMPTLSTFILLIFLSIWDIIAVFKGPLGKISELIMENRKKMQDAMEKRMQDAETSPPPTINSSSSNENVSETTIAPVSPSKSLPSSGDESVPIPSVEDDLNVPFDKEDIGDVEIELGSGDLIFYSALVAHVIIRTGSWFLGIMVIIGVVLGAYLTIRRLFENKKVLPALPFSMFLGIGMYLLGWLIRYLIAL